MFDFAYHLWDDISRQVFNGWTSNYSVISLLVLCKVLNKLWIVFCLIRISWQTVARSMTRLICRLLEGGLQCYFCFPQSLILILKKPYRAHHGSFECTGILHLTLSFCLRFLPVSSSYLFLLRVLPSNLLLSSVVKWSDTL